MKVSKENPIIAYKGFEADWSCRGFQYKVGKSYEITNEICMCRNGFHAGASLRKVFMYYGSAPWNRFAKVALWGDVLDDEGHKYCSSNIEILEEIPYTKLYEICNIGNFNKGFWNVGGGNTGNGNIGDDNDGCDNLGSLNRGNYNCGDKNTGILNIGSRNSGDFNIGELNQGSYNIGNYNMGWFNLGNHNTGCFNTKSWPDYRWFDEPSQGSLIQEEILAKFLFVGQNYFQHSLAVTPIIEVAGGKIELERLVKIGICLSYLKMMLERHPNYQQDKLDSILDTYTETYEKERKAAEEAALKRVKEIENDLKINYCYGTRRVFV